MFSKKILVSLFALILVGGITACEDASDAMSTVPQGGSGGSSGASSSSGSGGSSGTSSSSGSGGNTGGSGGDECVGPCCSVSPGETAIIFDAPYVPALHQVAISAWVHCEHESASCISTDWWSPWPGSVASAGENTAIAIFGDLPPFTTIEFLGSLHESDTTPATLYYAYYDEHEVLVREGDYTACLGHMAVGEYMEEEGSTGSIKPATSSNNLVYTVPEPE